MAVPLVLFAGLALGPMGRELALSRESELTLLRLRGVRPMRLVWRCLAEPLPVVLAAAAAGVGSAHCWSGWLRHAWPEAEQPGHGLGRHSLARHPSALVGVALAALTAGMIAVLLDPLGRQVTGAPARPRRAWPAAVTRVALLSMTAFVVYDVAEDSQPLPAWEVWAGPILIGLVVAELLLLLLPRLARLTARLAEPAPLPRWLALRRLGRLGPAAGPVRLLVTAGVLSGFAVSGAITSSDWVDDAARVQNGAAYQFELDASAPNAIVLTERLDPDGEHLVAAVLLPQGTADEGRAGWVDAARYERVIGEELADTGASGVPATMPDLATETTSGMTTTETFSVAGRFLAGRPGTTVRVDLEYLTGTNDMDTATISVQWPAEGPIRERSPARGLRTGLRARVRDRPQRRDRQRGVRVTGLRDDRARRRRLDPLRTRRPVGVDDGPGASGPVLPGPARLRRAASRGALRTGAGR